tara:strand:- start:568 stop:966 length:399 start_codon:yes stop_codon:yes gene_type:complete
MEINDRETLALLPSFSIAFLNWCFNIFLLDKYRGILKFKKSEIYALFVSMLGGFASWITTMSIKEENMMTLQVTSSVFRAFTSWLVLVIIVNEDITLSRQQFISFLFRLLMTILLEIQQRLVISPWNYPEDL